METAAVEMRQLIDSHLTRPMYGQSSVELIAGIDACCQLKKLIDGMTLAYVREIDLQGIAKAQGATSTTAWLADRHRLTPWKAQQWVRLGRALDRAAAMHPDEPPDPDASAPPGTPAAEDDFPDPDLIVLPHGIRTTRDALAAGLVSLDQAQAIVTAIHRLPKEHQAAAETHLIGEAQRFNPKILNFLGAYVLRKVAPDQADALEAEALRRSEARAYADRRLHLAPLPHGGIRLTGNFDSEQGAIIKAAIDALCSPHTTGGDDNREYPQRRADAITDICNLALSSQQLPDNGGERPHIVVTMGLTDLCGNVGIGVLEDGTPISATAARRMACDANVIPAVLNGKGLPLDVGRERRLFLGAVRRAIMIRDGGCAFPACDRSPRWSQGHHILCWLDGGTTCLANGVGLCGHHHRLIHDGQWEVRINAIDGFPDFIPPAYVDSQRRPRRNNYHIRP